MALLNLLSTLTQAVPYIRAQYKGKDLGPQKQTAAELANVTNAQYNMDNPLYQGLYEQNRQSGQQDLARTIAEISRQNRKLTSMGRNPLLDQQRGGESVFRNLIMGQQDVGNQARENTFGQLRNAASGLGATYAAQGGIADRGYENEISRANAFYGIGGLGRSYNPQTQSFGENEMFPGQNSQYNQFGPFGQSGNEDELRTLLRRLLGQR